MVVDVVSLGLFRRLDLPGQQIHGAQRSPIYGVMIAHIVGDLVTFHARHGRHRLTIWPPPPMLQPCRHPQPRIVHHSLFPLIDPAGTMRTLIPGAATHKIEIPSAVTVSAIIRAKAITRQQNQLLTTRTRHPPLLLSAANISPINRPTSQLGFADRKQHRISDIGLPRQRPLVSRRRILNAVLLQLVEHEKPHPPLSKKPRGSRRPNFDHHVQQVDVAQTDVVFVRTQVRGRCAFDTLQQPPPSHITSLFVIRKHNTRVSRPVPRHPANDIKASLRSS